MEAYEAAKRRLFAELPQLTEVPMVAALNVDDPVGARWARQVSVGHIEYGLDALLATSGSEATTLFADVNEVRVDRIRLRLHAPSLSYPSTTEIVVPLGGAFNVQNCLSAAAGMLALGYTLVDVEQALPKVRPVPGRFEAVPNEKEVGVIVDYAHTPDALEKLLDSVRALRPRRVLSVFGCGGDRDRTKRPQMARSASVRSDLTVVTSDNPRTEDPRSILEEIEAGITPGRAFVCIVDRREAITYAVGAAQAGDVVVIAGKGHEDYQIIGRTKHPMDDRQMAREALEGRA